MTHLSFSTVAVAVWDTSIKHWQPCGRQSSTPARIAATVRTGGAFLGRGSGQTTSSSVCSSVCSVSSCVGVSSPPPSSTLQRLVLGSETGARAASCATKTLDSCIFLWMVSSYLCTQYSEVQTESILGLGYYTRVFKTSPVLLMCRSHILKRLQCTKDKRTHTSEMHSSGKINNSCLNRQLYDYLTVPPAFGPPLTWWANTGQLRSRIPKKGLHSLAHWLGKRGQVISTLPTKTQTNKHIISQWVYSTWPHRKSILKLSQSSGLTSRTAHNFPPARGINRCVRWAKISGVAHMWP